MTRAFRALGWIALATLGACSRGGSSAAKPADKVTFELRSVSKSEVARLLKLVSVPEIPKPDAELVERVNGLVSDAAHGHGKMRTLALRDGAALGVAIVPLLEAVVDDAQRDPDERRFALEVLGAIDAPAAADVLAKYIDIQKMREPWVRAQAAFQLAKQSSDHWLPRVISQLKYESDGETVIWMAAALAKHGNFAGVEGLRVLATTAASEEVRSDAAAKFAELAQTAGFASADALYAAWYGADPEKKLPHVAPSPRLQLEMWKQIAQLEAFDLRLVDDARFSLSRSADWILDPLIAALHDDQVHVRSGVAQALERMGPRANPACAELARALDEPRVAGDAAIALGAIGCQDAVTLLVERTLPGRDEEVRTPAAVALGRLGRPEVVAPLEALLAPAEPIDLRQAAAQSLLSIGAHPRAFEVLVTCLTKSNADASAAESALDAFLAREAASGGEAARKRLADWRAIGADVTGTPTPEQSVTRRTARAHLLAPSGTPPGAAR